MRTACSGIRQTSYFKVYIQLASHQVEINCGICMFKSVTHIIPLLKGSINKKKVDDSFTFQYWGHKVQTTVYILTQQVLRVLSENVIDRPRRSTYFRIWAQCRFNCYCRHRTEIIISPFIDNPALKKAFPQNLYRQTKYGKS